ncbi:phenylalanine--tRNA ligase subunit beta [Candidatus Parcubacteria bacterium]|uniref:phenylalanine--tRNA ligase n=1 Tax=Candidatus Kaiserbacteria bacterium CG10_big_fil_rev_8_21_14_0_10_47_16 TaxID=1974608 RepID=A0A2H0UE91_9BACT|nr:phenylalanine--tRNA ligase subunit beta [Candidatus Parcubacteria bacterium]PIR84711.1 MAG: hypothetical protein COU16_00800 [Candidatus Kaiserbacteria bacterium CG10_big_fil_rev_8_21_14_0_10_47_16]
MKVVYDWLEEYLGENAPSSEKVADLLTFHAFEIEGTEVKGDHTVIDVDVLPNRAADCLSHRGIAREIASITGVPLAHDPLTVRPELPTTDKLVATITNPEHCSRLTLALMEGVTIGDSPEWLKSRLQALGQRSINNVVDATNYVMLSLGQPLHAYDAAKWQEKDGTYHVGVRAAAAGETITVLTGETYELTPRAQLIVDTTNDAPASIAGIKGGTYAEIGKETTTIILEAAHFNPSVTRVASQFLKLQTDASKRFENDLSPELTPYALDAVVKLITDIAGGTLVGITDTYPMARSQSRVAVTEAKTNALLGLSLTREEMKDILVRIGATVEETKEGFVAVGPWERNDLDIEEDFIEEIGRIYGYEHVAPIVPEQILLKEINARHYYSERVREVLIGLGFFEVITSSFRKKDEIRLQNALASDKEYLRSSLKKNIIEVLDKNIPLVDVLGVRDIRVFEIGTVFSKGDGGVTERFSLAFGARTRQDGYNPKDDAVLTEAMSVLEKDLGVSLGTQIEKGVVEIAFTELITQLPQPTVYEPQPVGAEIQYKAFSQYPHIARDIALWVSEGTTAADVIAVLQKEAGDLCVRITLFDEFTKDGRTSFAFRLVFQSYEKTLASEEVDTIMEKIYAAVKGNDWEVR